MRAQPTPRTARQSGWTVASQWLAPYLDPVIGVVAAAAALASLLATDPSSVDPRLEDPDLLSVVATLAAAGGLAWRRSRPLASYAVFVCGSLAVSLTGHYIGLLSVLLLFSMYSLAAHGRRRHALIGLGVGMLCFIGLALLDYPTSVPPTCSRPWPFCWPLGRSGMRSGRDGACRPTTFAPP